MSKLPGITAFFWIMNICATTLGETAGDLLPMTLIAGLLALVLAAHYFSQISQVLLF